MQMRLMRRMVLLGKSVLFLRHDPARGFGERRSISVWWKGRGGNADLMLLLAHIIQEHPEWRSARIRLLRVISSAEGIAQTRAHMVRLLKDVRVEAEPVILVHQEKDRPVTDLIATASRDSDLTLLGLNLPDREHTAAYGEAVDRMIDGVGTVLLVRNAEADEDLLAVS